MTSSLSTTGFALLRNIGYTVTAIATPEEIRKLRQDSYRVVQHEDADELGKRGSARSASAIAMCGPASNTRSRA